MRTALAGLDPDLFFKTCSVDELFKLDFAQLPVPFVLKPSVGFCSMGVYAIQNREDWGARSGRHPAERLVVARHVPRKRHRRRVVHSRRLS